MDGHAVASLLRLCTELQTEIFEYACVENKQSGRKQVHGMPAHLTKPGLAMRLVCKALEPVAVEAYYNVNTIIVTSGLSTIMATSGMNTTSSPDNGGMTTALVAGRMLRYDATMRPHAGYGIVEYRHILLPSPSLKTYIKHLTLGLFIPLALEKTQTDDAFIRDHVENREWLLPILVILMDETYLHLRNFKVVFRAYSPPTGVFPAFDEWVTSKLVEIPGFEAQVRSGRAQLLFRTNGKQFAKTQ
ncbi:hypothetical protein LTR08_003654 [Meristemomyces frigidus]|nr:hypothetical protein LTR08_003654 [Meristemomyces frigidus]